MSDRTVLLAVVVLMALAVLNEISFGDLRLLLMGVGFVALLGVLAFDRQGQ